MDLGLQGKKAIVTGATRGIGRAIADLLVKESCDIGICARSASGVNDAVAAFQNRGVKSADVAGDPADKDMADALVEDELDGYAGDPPGSARSP